jgi:hypothetical protein
VAWFGLRHFQKFEIAFVLSILFLVLLSDFDWIDSNYSARQASKANRKLVLCGILVKVYLHELKTTLCLYGVYLLCTRISSSTFAYDALAAPFLFPGRQIVLPSYHREQFGGCLALSHHSSLLQCRTRPRRLVHCLLFDRKAQ